MTSPDYSSSSSSALRDPSPSGILTGLKTESDHEERLQIILLAEEAHFSEEQRKELAPILLKFIEANRDSRSDRDLTVVASAVRRYVSVLPLEDLKSVVGLLHPKDGVTVSPDIQLEVLKMLARTYSVIPPRVRDPEPELALEVFELTKAHLNPYVFKGEKNAAIAFQGCLTLAGMLSPLAGEVFTKINELPYAWFRRLLLRECDKLAKKWEEKADHSILAGLKATVSLLEKTQRTEESGIASA
ncbi:MAG: hypothetical protein KC978_16195 [Candidatus Omnitrophica bacterium]|nr:hypothetical protein [Candidatus Omnitrophota bacterium]